MKKRVLGPSVVLGFGIAGAWGLLAWMDEVPVAIPPRVLSSVYNAVLLVIAASSAVLLHGVFSLGGHSRARDSSRLTLTPRRAVEYLGAMATALVGVHSLDYVLKQVVDFDYQRVMPLFDLGREVNLPTLYSTALLLLCVVLLSVITALRKGRAQDHLHWAGLAGVFSFLAFDEFIGIHELISTTTVRSSTPSLLSGREWVLVYGALLIPFGLAYLPFLRRLGSSTRRIFVVAGLTYVSGALGVEVICGWLLERVIPFGHAHSLLIVSEEALEMAGVLIFIYGLLAYMENELGTSLGTRHYARIEDVGSGSLAEPPDSRARGGREPGLE